MGKISPIIRQYMAVACCNLLTLSFGLADGWATINYLELQSENSTFSIGPLTSEQLALVISIGSIGGFLGNFAVVPISRSIGLKNTIHLFGVPLIISSLLIIWAQNVYYLYVSKVMSGFVCGGTIVAITLLINDISFDNARGALNSIYDPSYNTGIIISFYLGSHLNCLDQAKVQLILPAIFMVVLFLLPESPEYWTKRNNEKRARKSNEFYKGNITQPAPEITEFLPKTPNEKTKQELPEIVQDDDSANTSMYERLSSAFKQFQTPLAKKALFISLASALISFFCGPLLILGYVTDIFNKTGSSLSEKNSSLLVSITTLVANLLFLNIVERINRKTLYIGSSILTALCYFSFAAYCLLWLKQPEYEWMPPFCFACIIWFSCMGLLPIPFILPIEILPKEIRDIGLTIMVSLIWFILFVLGYMFPFVLNSIGLVACMSILGTFCILNAIFGLLFIPETRGKSHDEIMNNLLEQPLILTNAV